MIASLSCCALDIETAPLARALPAPSSGRGRKGDDGAGHGLTCASVVLFEEAGCRIVPGSVRLLTFERRLGEAEILRCIDATLPDPVAGNMVVTFNGRGWDLPTMRQRAMANWLFELTRITAWNAAGDDHRDLMLQLSNGGAGRWQSLEAACGSLCIPAKDLPPRAARSDDAVALGNQCDAVATFLLHLHLRSLELGTPMPLATGWIELAASLALSGRAPSHLAPYVDHPRIELARAVLASEARTASANS
jgi:hypothetical protein